MPLYPYIKVIFFSSDTELGLRDGHFRKEEVIVQLTKSLSKILGQFKIDELFDLGFVAEQLFEDFVEAGIVEPEKLAFAGTYYSRSKNAVTDHRAHFLNSSEIHGVAGRIGSRFFPDVFDGYRQQLEVVDQLESPVEAASLVRSETISQVDWGSVRSGISDEKFNEIRDRAAGLIDAVQQSELTDRQKANAIAHANAVIRLLDAPDPPWEIIVDLLNNRYFSAILNAAAILQLILMAAS